MFTLDVLSTTLRLLSQASLPPASKCRLYLVNRDALFSYHEASEAFLHGLLSLFVSSHYKNTPNDLMLMADAPAHLLFAFLPPVDEHTDTVPDIYCAIQVRQERGFGSRQVSRFLFPLGVVYVTTRGGRGAFSNVVQLLREKIYSVS